MSGEPHKPSRFAHALDDEPPPFLGRWGRIYALVLCYLALLIFGFYLFTRDFAS